MDNQTLTNILLVLACSFVAFLALLLVLAFFAMRWLRHFIAPDIGEMKRELDEQRVANPALSTDALVSKIIREQSFKCGIVGAITGLGGFITLPVALPVDILMSMRIQSAMVQFIALAYNQTDMSENELALQTTLVMSGGVKATETATGLIMRGVVRLLGESLAIVVPAIGALVGFVVNYGISQATGTVAMRWYAAKQLSSGTRPAAINAPRR